MIPPVVFLVPQLIVQSNSVLGKMFGKELLRSTAVTEGSSCWDPPGGSVQIMGHGLRRVYLSVVSDRKKYLT